MKKKGVSEWISMVDLNEEYSPERQEEEYQCLTVGVQHECVDASVISSAAATLGSGLEFKLNALKVLLNRSPSRSLITGWHSLSISLTLLALLKIGYASGPSSWTASPCMSSNSSNFIGGVAGH